MSRWDLFVRGIQLDFRLYVFVLALISVFRIIFFLLFQTDMNPAITSRDIMTALFYGTLLSLRAIIPIVLVSFVFCTLLNIVVKREIGEKMRILWAWLCLSLFTLLFHARATYYKEFRISSTKCCLMLCAMIFSHCWQALHFKNSTNFTPYKWVRQRVAIARR